MVVAVAVVAVVVILGRGGGGGGRELHQSTNDSVFGEPHVKSFNSCPLIIKAFSYEGPCSIPFCSP